jgi:diguanylate cyclase (GGDEF)-like protein
VFAAQLVKANALAIVLALVRNRTIRRMDQARRQIRRMALTDELTGLANHRGLLEIAPTLLHGNPGPRADLAVVYLDVDGLKAVNDTQGHLAGDELLRSVARVLRRAFRSTDVIARVGGDEFAVLLVGADPNVTQRVLTRVHEELHQAGISVSTGTAQPAPGSLDSELADLLDEADHAMYAAKAGRKNDTC